jgi:hypothetical protein
MQGQYGEPLGSDQTPLRLERDRWHRITLRVTMQSAPDRTDGRTIDRLLLETFCGGAGKTPEKDEFVYFDDIRWETARR